MTAPAPNTAPIAVHLWARQGFQVVPFLKYARGKAPPKGFTWKDGGLTSASDINAWWRRHPNALIGTIMPEGWCVIDIDTHADRPNGFATLKSKGLLNKVRTGIRVKTPSGGEHYWFRTDKTFVSRGLLDGVDMRSTGRIVIVPGSKGYTTPGIKGLAEFFKQIKNAPTLPSEIEALTELKRKRASSDRDPEELRMPEEHARLCIEHIANPNDDWDTWKKNIGAIYAASDGDAWGNELAHEYSSKSDKYDYDGTENAWIEVERSPYSDVGGGTLVHLARKGGMPDDALAAPATDVFDDESTAEDMLEDCTPDQRRIVEDLLGGDAPSSWLDFKPVTRWRDTPPKPMRFTVKGMLLEGTVMGMIGDGGSAKSYITQIMATCVAAGTPFNGQEVMQGSAVYITGEDPDNALHYRQLSINKMLDVEMLPNLYVQSATEEDFTLYRNGRVQKLLEKIEKRLSRIRDLRLLVIDNAAVVYDDDEINRQRVTAFVRALTRMAARLRIGITLVVHTNKGGQISGSTAWKNGFRSAFLFTRGKEVVSIAVDKPPNHAEPIAPTQWHWTNGCWSLIEVSAEDRETTDNEVRRAAYDLVKQRWEEKNPVSEAPSSAYYLPKVMVRDEAAPSQQEAEQAMRWLLKQGWIERTNALRRSGALKPSDQEWTGEE